MIDQLRAKREESTGASAYLGKLKVREAAKYTGASVSYLDKCRVSGDGPEFLQYGSACFYEIEALDRWMAERRRTKTARKLTRRVPAETANAA
jgi:hypothetical protein